MGPLTRSITQPDSSLANLLGVPTSGSEWLALGFTATAKGAQLGFTVIVFDGAMNKIFISPVTMVTADLAATDGLFFGRGGIPEDTLMKIPSSGVSAIVRVEFLNPANPAPPAPAVVTWNLVVTPC